MRTWRGRPQQCTSAAHDEQKDGTQLPPLMSRSDKHTDTCKTAGDLRRRWPHGQDAAAAAAPSLSCSLTPNDVRPLPRRPPQGTLPCNMDLRTCHHSESGLLFLPLLLYLHLQLSCGLHGRQQLYGGVGDCQHAPLHHPRAEHHLGGPGGAAGAAVHLPCLHLERLPGEHVLGEADLQGKQVWVVSL